MSRFKYNPGDTVGPYNIVMKERTYKDKSGWHAIFICPFNHNDNYEHTFETLISKVQQGVTKSCGCYRSTRMQEVGKGSFKDLSNQHFGKLTALYPTFKRNAAGHVYWMCECNCEAKTKIEISSNALSTGHTVSCGCISSKGEMYISKYLQELDISFIKEYVFSNFRYKDTNGIPRFDFYLPDYNCCIEYDGEQHYKANNQGWNTEEKLQYTKKVDCIKTEFCKNNDISLIRIPYTDYKKLSKEYLLKKLEEI